MKYISVFLVIVWSSSLMLFSQKANGWSPVQNQFLAYHENSDLQANETIHQRSSLSSTWQDTIELRVLSYNIYHGATMVGDFNLDTIANRFLAHNPDLVAMQEVDRFTRRAGNLDLVTELAGKTRLTPLFGRAMYFDSGEYGVGILSKFSFIQTNNLNLPGSPDKEPRVALETIFQLPGGDTIVFVATHFDHTRNSSDRFAQAEMLATRYKNYPYPVILAGDLNDTPESKTINILSKVFEMSDGEQLKPTYPSDHPVKKIDYIMTDKNHHWEVIGTEVIEDKIVSDHCGYFAIIQLIRK